MTSISTRYIKSGVLSLVLLFVLLSGVFFPNFALATPNASTSTSPEETINLVPAETVNTSTHVVAWNRLWGQGQYDTMKSIVSQGWASSNTVIVATGNGYWDALSAAGVAGIFNAPVLITDKKRLSPQTKTLLQKLKPSTVILAGGPSVLTTDVENEIKKVTKCDIQRVYGQTATDTAAELNKTFASLNKWSQTAILATSKGFQDALSAAPVAYAKHYPIFLTENKTTISLRTVKAMKACGVKNVLVVGGTGVIADSLLNRLKSEGISVKARLWGKTAIDTSRAIAEWGIKNGMKANRVGVATSKNYPDALCGAALCGKNNAVLVLAASKNSVTITKTLANNRTKIDIGYVFGGSSVVTATTYNKIKQVTNPVTATTKVVTTSGTKKTSTTRNNPSGSASGGSTRTVYITNSGSKYHKAGCRYLKKSKTAITESAARAQGYSPCGVCGG